MDICIGLLIIGYVLGWIVFPVWWTLIPEPKGFAKSSPADFNLFKGTEGLDEW